MRFLKRDMNKQQLDISMAMLDAYSEERRRQHAEINRSLDKAIRSLKHQLWCWAAVIVVSTFIIVETVISLI
jgi:hypothetical protein